MNMIIITKKIAAYFHKQLFKIRQIIISFLKYESLLPHLLTNQD
jgi:hypothetical protein